MVLSDVRRSDLANKHIKRSIAVFIQVFSIEIQIQIHWLQFNSIRLNSNQDSCIQRCVLITIYSFLESDVLLKYDPHNFGVRRDRSFISPYFGDLDELIFHNFDDPDRIFMQLRRREKERKPVMYRLFYFFTECTENCGR